MGSVSTVLDFEDCTRTKKQIAELMRFIGGLSSCLEHPVISESQTKLLKEAMEASLFHKAWYLPMTSKCKELKIYSMQKHPKLPNHAGNALYQRNRWKINQMRDIYLLFYIISSFKVVLGKSRFCLLFYKYAQVSFDLT